ncbi:MAG TPA: hypothetical protein PKY82_20255 [Pyrinomonadaceae bacterium]|nr:hypothetical protein [Pyrinomonadaceae bacterium]
MIKSLISGILILFALFNNQSKVIFKETSPNEQGEQIINDARKAIGIENNKISSFILKSKRILIAKSDTTSSRPPVVLGTEISAKMPDKVQLISTAEEPSRFKYTSIWNGVKYKKLSEINTLGERTIKDVTESSLNTKERLKVLEGKIDKNELEKIKLVANTDPKEKLNNQIWLEIFPLILNNPFEQNLEFIYVGKSESSNRIANVVDVKSKNERNYRFLFDTETNLLLMTIETFKGTDGDYEIKYYYSNREKVDGLLIPKKIKAEQRITSAGKEPRISYSNIEILEFK